MTKPKTSKQEIINKLRREVDELKAQMAYTYVMASSQIQNAGFSSMMAGGVLLQLTALGGRVLVEPVVIRDGLSKETITALYNDIRRSYDLTVLHKPGALKEK